jgi:hypothetical protein
LDLSMPTDKDPSAVSEKGTDSASGGALPTADELLQLYANGERQFARAVLRGACFDAAILRDVNLEGADLTGASFRGAMLERAQLTGAVGLLPRQLAGANLRGAQLPSSVGEFTDLKRAQQLADSAQKLFLGILGGCAYTVLTVATITDPQLMLASVPAELPIIKTSIPTLGFFWVVPFVLAGLFVYFHLYLQRLWETLAGLPAILPDGRSSSAPIHSSSAGSNSSACGRSAIGCPRSAHIARSLRPAA